MAKPLKQFEETALFNNKTFIDYCDRLKLLATSIFSWGGLDEKAGDGASRFIEQALYENGKACFVKDPEVGYLALNAAPAAKLNVYRLPTKINAWSIGYSKIYDFDDIVYILNNDLGLATQGTLDLFAYRLYNTQRAIDVNINAQKTPILIEGDTKSILTLKNVYMQYSGNEPVIFGNKNFDLNNRLNVLSTQAPFIADKLDVHLHNIFNDILTYLGIDNANTDKKERLIVSEAESNERLVNFYMNCFYKTRKKAADLINKKFFNNEEVITIEMNENYLTLLAQMKGDDELGQIHDHDQEFD